MNQPHPEYLTEAADLNGRLDDPNLQIFDATVFLTRGENGMVAESGRSAYLEGHIPGAAFLDLIEALSDTSSGLGFTLPAPEALEAAIGNAGVQSDAEVVLYSTGSMMWATRAWWLLHAAGHNNVRVLNGGLAAWREAGGSLTGEPRDYPASDFRGTFRGERFASKAAVLSAIGERGSCTVNALPAAMYTGESPVNYGRKGHITGSTNLSYDALLTNERFKPVEALRGALEEQGMLSSDRVITYCGGGIAATVNAFACLLVGKDDVAVYDGSLSEWVRDPSAPMTEGAEPG